MSHSIHYSFFRDAAGSVTSVAGRSKLKLPANLSIGLIGDLARVDPSNLAGLLTKISDTAGRNKFRVLCHGDYHMWNVAFLPNVVDSDYSAGDLAVFDYQV